MSRPRALSHETSVMLYALAASLPAALVALGFLWLEPHPAKLRWTLTLFCVGVCAGLLAKVREQVASPLQTLSNLLAGLREGDFSIRGHHSGDDALGVAFGEVNALSATLRRERHGAVEASALVRKAIEAIEVAVFIVDEDGEVTLGNASAARLVGVAAGALVGKPAASLGLGALLDGDSPRTVAATLGGVSRQLEVRRGPLRQEGRSATLVVAADVSRALRAEERQAFERMARVLGHEINNSLAPIRSIAEGLEQRVGRADIADIQLATDLQRGLEVIERRADSLGRLTTSYARLMRLPAPRMEAVDVAAWVRRVAPLDTRRPVAVHEGASALVRGDADQLDQVLINLVRNAVDAALETGGGVELGWEAAAESVFVVVRDEGPGLSDTANLFVPFFTTKPNGSGIGLVLSRQIVEGHGGTLALVERRDRRGCEARIALPRAG